MRFYRKKERLIRNIGDVVKMFKCLISNSYDPLFFKKRWSFGIEAYCHEVVFSFDIHIFIKCHCYLLLIIKFRTYQLLEMSISNTQS
jgi:hypothetical protein